MDLARRERSRKVWRALKRVQSKRTFGVGMSRFAAVSVMVWLATMVSGPRMALAQDPSAGATVPASRAGASAGVLQRPPSSIYYAFKSSTEARQAPDRSAPVVFTIGSENQSFKAVGMVVEPEPEGQASEGPWIKLRSPSGTLGFVALAELITPQQLEAKKQSIKKLSMFETELDAVRRASSSAIPAGIYSLGGSCDAGFDGQSDTIAFLNNKVLVWQEADRLHFVHVLDPMTPVVYAMQNDSRTVELQGFGYVQMKTFRSDQDTALMGFKNKLLWFSASGTQFDNYQLCDAGTNESVLAMLRSYAHQRPPEEVRTTPAHPAQ